MKLIQNILEEWAYRVDNGMPNVKNPYHLVQLENVLVEKKLPKPVIELLLSKLREEERKYKDNYQNRKLNRVGKVYGTKGDEKKEKPEKKLKTNEENKNMLKKIINHIFIYI